MELLKGLTCAMLDVLSQWDSYHNPITFPLGHEIMVELYTLFNVRGVDEVLTLVVSNCHYYIKPFFEILYEVYIFVSELICYLHKG